MCDALNELFAEELKEADLRGRTEGLRLGRSEGLQLGKSEVFIKPQWKPIKKWDLIIKTPTPE